MYMRDQKAFGYNSIKVPSFISWMSSEGFLNYILIILENNIILHYNQINVSTSHPIKITMGDTT